MTEEQLEKFPEGEWVPYDMDYYKAFQDIKLKDGAIHLFTYPNAGKFHNASPLGEYFKPIPEEEVEFVRLTSEIYQEECFKRNSEERDKRVIIIGEPSFGSSVAQAIYKPKEAYIHEELNKELREISDFQYMLKNDTCKKGHKYIQVGVENHVAIWECRCGKRL